MEIVCVILNLSFISLFIDYQFGSQHGELGTGTGELGTVLESDLEN